MCKPRVKRNAAGILVHFPTNLKFSHSQNSFRPVYKKLQGHLQCLTGKVKRKIESAKTSVSFDRVFEWKTLRPVTDAIQIQELLALLIRQRLELEENHEVHLVCSLTEFLTKNISDDRKTKHHMQNLKNWQKRLIQLKEWMLMRPIANFRFYEMGGCASIHPQRAEAEIYGSISMHYFAWENCGGESSSSSSHQFRLIRVPAILLRRQRPKQDRYPTK